MPNLRYPYGNQKILEGDIAWNDGPICAVLVGTASYSYNPVHRHLADIPVGARVATSGTLTGRTSTLGVADADNLVFTAVGAGPRIDTVVLFNNTGDETDSVLIAYMSDGIGLPVHPDGSDVSISWDNGANRIFVL